MDDTGYKVRFSKGWTLFGSLFVSIVGGGIFTGLIVLAIVGIVSPNDAKGNDILGDVLGLCISIMFLGFIIFGVIYIIWTYKKIVDIYYKDKMIRMNGKKEKFTIEYKNIVSIKQEYFGIIFIFCKEPITLKNQKKGPKTLIEYYKKEDIYRIKQIIGNANYNLISN